MKFLAQGTRGLLLKNALVPLLAGVLWMPHSQAQVSGDNYPNKPIRMVVTFPPGGSSDAVVRLLLPRLADKLGQPIVVDNRPGAGGNIGLSLVAKAAPDGYTLGVGAAGGLAANVSLYPQMPFDPVKDFKPVTLLASSPFVLVANPGISAKTLPELIAQAKAAPGKFSIGHGGNGTAMHLSSQLLAQLAGVQFVEVPYRGSGPATLDALAGQVPLAMVDLVAALPTSRPASCWRWLSQARSASPRCPTCPPWLRPACRVMSPLAGSAWSPPQARLPALWPGSTPKWWPRWPTRRSPAPCAPRAWNRRRPGPKSLNASSKAKRKSGPRSSRPRAPSSNRCPACRNDPSAFCRRVDL